MEEQHTDMLARERGLRISKRNEEVYSIEVRINGHVIEIRGKIDGILTEEGQPVIVETKTRRNRLFRSIPLYEKVQIETYMRMVGAHKAVLNQRMACADKAPLGPPTLLYARDDALWKSVLDGLAVFVQKADLSNRHGGI